MSILKFLRPDDGNNQISDQQDADQTHDQFPHDYNLRQPTAAKRQRAKNNRVIKM
jgi:hypothetical protein